MQQSSSHYGVSPEIVAYPGGRSHMLDHLQQQHLLQQQQKPRDVVTVLAEAASPISSRPPAQVNFEELAPGASRFPDEDGLMGDDVERGATSGNRWPRQETLALLKIRSEMDAAFKGATLKGPLWEDISRKLGVLGYSRSAKKCKEKFENVQKYYKRTKEGRAGRQDGRNYRFFTELEALHNSSNAANTASIAATTAPPVVPVSGTMGSSNPMVVSSAGIIQSPAMASAPAVTASERPDSTINVPAVGISGSAAAAISFSSNSSSSSGSEEDDIEEGLNMDTKKRKRSQMGGGSNKNMMAFFERLMKEVMEKQEGMMQRFLEAIEKREQDRMIREEAWRRQEMAKLTHEQELMAHERAIAASKDATMIAFLQQITGQTFQIITPVTIPTPAPPMQPNPPPPPPKLQQQQQQPQQRQQQHRQQQSQVIEVTPHQAQSSEVTVLQEQQEATGMSFDSTSSRWPKAEVLALIKLRTSLDSKYLESGPKGPLWEDISAGMQQLGYKRSAKRCKEKWENINKYFKKVKDSNKKRPEDAKTCPYFHELDMLYRNKLLKSSASSYGTKQEQEMNPDSGTKPQETRNVLAILPPPVCNCN